MQFSFSLARSLNLFRSIQVILIASKQVAAKQWQPRNKLATFQATANTQTARRLYLLANE